MKRIVALFVLLVVVAALFAGCGASANDISGLWYEETGYGGTLEFKAGGNFKMEMMGVPLEGKYTFDAAKGTGTMTLFGEEGKFKLENGKLNLDGAVYTRTKVEQQNIGDLLEGLGGALEGMGN